MAPLKSQQTITTTANLSCTKLRHHQQHRPQRMLSMFLCYAIFTLMLQPTWTKSLDIAGGDNGGNRPQLFNDDASNDNVRQCDALKGYMATIDIKPRGNNNEKGAICSGNCCSNSTETELKKKATQAFESLLHHHTESLRGILKSTAELFENHVLELAGHSENKTLSIFSAVYKQEVPFSRKLIQQLYSEIRSHLLIKNFGTPLNSLEEAIHKFFVNLFPIAYHHISTPNEGELHEDYVNCLKHAFDDLQPFGNIPRELKHNLVQSTHTATIFMSSLMQSAEVLSETDELYGMYLAESCKKHLLKMNYCPSCNGYTKKQAKPCYSYCMNVLRGCSAQYAGALDSPWSNVADAIEKLVTSHIRPANGIASTIKGLDTKLSEAIMMAMENSTELEKKVKKTCGIPRLMAVTQSTTESRPKTQQFPKMASPPDAAILNFLASIDKSKEFYSNIVNNYCEDDDIQRNDHQCWTGDRIGDYTQVVMTTGIDTQRYNPEVPLETNSQSIKLNELVDKLIKIRKNIASAIPSSTRQYSDIQSDMARHDEDGSGHITDDADDEEYSIHSGDGSGDGQTPSPFDPTGGPTFVTNNDIEDRQSKDAAVSFTPTSFILIITTLVTLQFSNRITANRM